MAEKVNAKIKKMPQVMWEEEQKKYKELDLLEKFATVAIENVEEGGLLEDLQEAGIEYKKVKRILTKVVASSTARCIKLAEVGGGRLFGSVLATEIEEFCNQVIRKTIESKVVACLAKEVERKDVDTQKADEKLFQKIPEEAVENVENLIKAKKSEREALAVLYR